MNANYTRKKQPEIVRAKILQATAELVAEKGLAGVSLDIVARKAEISKGGLLHHFPSRQNLIESLFLQLEGEFQQLVEAYMADDPQPKGRFTRAYISAVTHCSKGLPFSTSVIAMCIDPHLAQLWAKWLTEYLVNCDSSENSPLARAARYAADGIWFEDCTNSSLMDSETRDKVIAQLVSLTYSI